MSFPFSRAGKCSKKRYEDALKTRAGCCPTRLAQKCQKAIFNKCCAKCTSGSCFRICALEGSSDIERNCWDKILRERVYRDNKIIII